MKILESWLVRKGPKAQEGGEDRMTVIKEIAPGAFAEQQEHFNAQTDSKRERLCHLRKVQHNQSE